MAILSFSEDWKAQKTSESLQSGQSATRVFNVYSDTHEELVSNVYAAIPVRLGDVFPGTFACLCTERNADRNTDDRTTWTVTCTYTSIINQQQAERITEPNPLNRATRISWSSRTVMRAVTRCQASGFYRTFSTNVAFSDSPDSVANSAGDPFDPPLEVPMTEWIMTGTKNVTAIPSWFVDYDNSVNDADVIILGGTYKKGTLKLEGIRLSEEMQENGISYRQLSWNVVIAKPRTPRTGVSQFYSVIETEEDGYVLVLHDDDEDEDVVPEPWDIEVLDEGMRRRATAEVSGRTITQWANIRDSYDQTDTSKDSVNKPIPLNGTGEPLFIYDSDIRPEYSLSWRLFRPYPRKNFAILPWA